MNELDKLRADIAARILPDIRLANARISAQLPGEVFDIDEQSAAVAVRQADALIRALGLADRVTSEVTDA